MNILWNLNEGFVQEIIAELPEPKPAYTTISTFMRILVQKEFVGFKSYGKSHQYYPLVSREEYMNSFMSNVKKNFFEGSFSSMLSFFARKEKLNEKQIKEILDLLNEGKEE